MAQVLCFEGALTKEREPGDGFLSCLFYIYDRASQMGGKGQNIKREADKGVDPRDLCSFSVLLLYIDKPLIHYEFTSLPASVAVAVFQRGCDGRQFAERDNEKEG